jgi:hypothetical protein
MRAASLANLTADPSKLRRQPPVTKCSECGAEPPREELFVKRVRWGSLPPFF